MTGDWQGDAATYRRIQPGDDLTAIFDAFNRNDQFNLCAGATTGLSDIPRFKNLMFERDGVRVWEIIPHGSTEVVGWAVISWVFHVIYLNTLFKDVQNPDLQVVEECIMKLVHLAFDEEHPANQTFVKMGHLVPMPEGLEETLIALGFDPTSPPLGRGNPRHTYFIMMRSTYDAYYGPDSGAPRT